jgi:transposase
MGRLDLRSLMAWRWVPPCEQASGKSRCAGWPSLQEDRCRQRERERLIQERTKRINRIKDLLMTQGVGDFVPMRRNWRAHPLAGRHERLAGLRTGDDHILPPAFKAEVEQESSGW